MAGTYTKLYYHIVFSTKNRQRFISPTIEEDLHKYISGILRNLGGASVEINGDEDHIHLLAILPPRIAVSDALRTIKANSSGWIHREKNLPVFGWQDGFAAFTVSKSQIEPVCQYIRDRKAHHAKGDFKSELIALLERHDVEYDERYLWN